MLLSTTTAGAHYSPGLHNVKHAINLHFCGKSTRNCLYARQALQVVWCESRYKTTARNGQYLGLFQMGSWERRTFGHGNSPWAQAKAAHKYFVYTGKDWSPWSCRHAIY
jgi:hypothetical protein